MPWEKAYDQSEVLERAMRAFWARGYQATSMGDLVAATGINRGSIYAAFDGKRALFIEALRHYDRIHRADYLKRIARSNAPRNAIIAAFEGAAASGFESDTPGGCLLVNTVLELSPHDPEIRDLVDASLREVEDFFRTMIEAAQRDGSVRAAIDAGSTAQALLGLFLGLRVLTRTTPRKEVVAAVTTQAKEMLT